MPLPPRLALRIWVPLLALLLGACATTNTPPVADADTVKPTGDTSATSLDWEGSYVGNLPCADCEGVEARLTLGGDLTYRITTTYLGTGRPPYTAAGRFSWDTQGRAIKLLHYRGGPNLYRVGENHLLPLDEAGQPLARGDAERFRLVKQAQVEAIRDPALLGRRWRLVELQGRAIAESDSTPHIAFDSEGQAVGSTGCNRFFASYAIPRLSRLQLSRMGATLMACADNTVEAEFLAALGDVDRYVVAGDRLTLQQGREKALLRFESTPR